MEHLARRQTAAVGLVSRGAAMGALGAVVASVGVYIGWAVSAGSVELLPLLVALVVALSILMPPHVFVAAALLVLGSYSLSANNPVSLAGAQLFSTDALLALVLLRAVLPRERTSSPAPLDNVARVLFGIWAVVMIVSGLRGVVDGHSVVSIIRLETPLVYAVAFYLGFGRLIRERSFDVDKAVRNLVLAALALIAYMAFARLTNSPFETEDTVGRLGTVVTTGGELRRDYGFASAFIVYPAIALAGAAYLLYSPRRSGTAATVMCVGIVTTVITLIRSEIFGLALGLVLIGLLRSDLVLRRAVRTRAIVAATLSLGIAAFALWVVSPTTARGVVERSLPGLLQQSRTADATADYRRDALQAGFESAERKPAGIGFIPEDGLTAADQVDLGYVAHSGVTKMLVYAGWFGLASAVLALFGLLRASFKAPRPVGWLHPFFVGSLLMLTVYTITADGLVGQAWVVGLAALIAALRFNARQAAQSGDLDSGQTLRARL